MQELQSCGGHVVHIWFYQQGPSRLSTTELGSTSRLLDVLLLLCAGTTATSTGPYSTLQMRQACKSQPSQTASTPTASALTPCVLVSFDTLLWFGLRALQPFISFVWPCTLSKPVGTTGSLHQQLAGPHVNNSAITWACFSCLAAVP